MIRPARPLVSWRCTGPAEMRFCSQSPSKHSAPPDCCVELHLHRVGRLNFFSCLRKYILCGVFLMMVGSHWRSWVMVLRRKQNESNSGDEGFSQDDGQMGCVLLKVHNNLHNLLVVQQQVVVAALRHQTFSLQQTHQCLR